MPSGDAPPVYSDLQIKSRKDIFKVSFLKYKLRNKKIIREVE
jgi:hypothetical protein